MKFEFRISIFLTLVWLGMIQSSAAGSPFAKVEPLPPGEVRWTRGFWADRFELCRTQMLPRMEALMTGTNYTQFLRNFEIAAGLAEGRSRGAQFNDGEFYKWLEGASATLAVTNDAALNLRLDESIGVIAKAQREDGYLHTHVLIRARNGDTNAIAFKDRNNWELYNMGHMLTAASVHYRATGKTNLLAVARQAADFLYARFADATPELAQGSVCPSHYVGLVDLFRATGDPRYLELLKKFFALRSQLKEGTDDNQDRIPFGQQTEAVGHAARANYLYAGATDLFLETGDTNLWKPLGPIWTNLVQKKMYITGGCGALFDGVSPDGVWDQRSVGRVHQAYGRNYELPNVTAHSETCANIGNALWNWRMFRATGEARFMDVVELALYNSVLSGGSLDGTNFFYTNPLRLTDPLPTPLRWNRTRVPFVNSFCCPPNLLRTIAESAGCAYAKSGGGEAASPVRVGDEGVAATPAIWVNLYGGSTLKTELAKGQTVRLTQETEYPWSGRVRITIAECGAGPFALKLRIPGWLGSHPATLRVNGRPVEVSATPSSYVELRRAWRPGDAVDLELPLPVRLMEANPLVEEDLNQVAFQRGPVVYCLESPDLPPGVKPLDVLISPEAEFRARYDRRLLGGIAVLEGTAFVRTNASWSGGLYRELRRDKSRPLGVRLIPYSVWANRGQSEMSVWLPRANP